jgi:hypothetical protein
MDRRQFFVWVNEEFGVQLQFYRDVEHGSGALELFYCYGRDGNVSLKYLHRSTSAIECIKAVL